MYISPSVNGYPLGVFPGRGKVTWRDWYTHDVVNATVIGNTTLSAPLGHINVHIRDGSALLLHAKPAYTIEETRAGPYSLLISLSSSGRAFGSSYIDDGVSYPPGPSKTLTFSVQDQAVSLKPAGPFHVNQTLHDITVLGISTKPKGVSLQGQGLSSWKFIAAQEKLAITELTIDLNQEVSLKWT